MIEAFKDLKHGHSNKSYTELGLEHQTSEILQHLEAAEHQGALDSLRSRILSNAHTIYGPTRHLDLITISPTTSRKTTAAIVEHSPTGRSYIHCTSAREHSRTEALDHLLIITEDLLARMVDACGIESCGWLPLSNSGAAAANSIAANSMAGGSVAGSVYPPTSVGGSLAGSVAGSVVGSRRGSVQPQQGISMQTQLMQARTGGSPTESLYSVPPGMALVRRSSDMALQQPQQHQHSGTVVHRTNSDIIHQPKPAPVGRAGVSRGAVRWEMGSDT